MKTKMKEELAHTHPRSERDRHVHDRLLSQRHIRHELYEFLVAIVRRSRELEGLALE
jgi:hypothetical protein